MKRSRTQVIAMSAWVVFLVFQPMVVSAEDMRPAQARVWDPFTRQAYLSGEDGDWDGINDDEERLGKILWGEIIDDDAAWCEGDEAETVVDGQLVSLPFAFPLGTQSWNQVWVGVNGTLGFEGDQSSSQARPLPASELGPKAFFAVFWDELSLNPAKGGRVWTLTPTNGRFVVCWEYLQLSGQAESSISFQAELCENGEMFWRYRELDAAGAAMTNGVTGIQANDLGWWIPSTMLRPDMALWVVSIDGLSPDNPDTDGDGIIDGIELYYYRPRTPGGRTLSPVVSDNPGDFDRDGLNVEQEYLHGQLDPFYWDTDGDMLSDGYEVSTRLLANNAEGIHGLYGDADGDGLSNYEERLYRSQPRLADSDGDGRNDADEIALGLNPTGPGGVKSPDWLAPVKLRLGDPGLDGKTEAYEMLIDALSGDTRGFTFQNTKYGVVQEQVIQLAIGGRYEVRIRHLGSVRSSNGAIDPDYIAGITGVDGTVIAGTDASGLLGQHFFDGSLPAGTEPLDTNRVATVWVQYRVLPDGSVPIADPIFKPRLSAWAAGRRSAAGSVNTEELSDPGVLVLPDYSAVMGAVLPAKIRLHGLDATSGCTRWLRFSSPSQISYKFSSMSGSFVPGVSEVKISGLTTADVDVEVRPAGAWPIGTTVIVECVVKDATGSAVIAKNSVRLIGQTVFALGDSLTYGFRRRSNGTYEMPLWKYPWLTYPARADWDGYWGVWSDIAYQGFRGYLMRDLTTSIPWAGHPANGHGPDHCGYAGSSTTDIASMLIDTSRTYPGSAVQAGPSDLVVFYFIGINDIIAGRNAATVYSHWLQGIDRILAKRSGHGRTLLVGVTLPKMSSRYFGYSNGRQQELIALNKKIRAYFPTAPYVRYVVADIENVTHDSDDDGLHFLAGGYARIEQILRQTLLNGLKQ